MTVAGTRPVVVDVHHLHLAAYRTGGSGALSLFRLLPKPRQLPLQRLDTSDELPVQQVLQTAVHAALLFPPVDEDGVGALDTAAISLEVPAKRAAVFLDLGQ